MTTREITIKESKGGFSLFRKQSKEKEEYDFSGITALRQLLNPEKARILNVIKEQKPESLYELAKKLNRSFKGVYEDVKLIERFGFVQIIEQKTKNRIRHKPQLVSDSITINIKFQ